MTTLIALLLPVTPAPPLTHTLTHTLTSTPTLPLHPPAKEKEEDEEGEQAIGDDSEREKTIMCIPKCRSAPALRTVFTAETSPFASFINIIMYVLIEEYNIDIHYRPMTPIIFVYLTYPNPHLLPSLYPTQCHQHHISRHRCRLHP